jgi:hypothetical protein
MVELIEDFINKDKIPPVIPIGRLIIKNILVAFCVRTISAAASSLVGRSSVNEAGFSLCTKYLYRIFIIGILMALKIIALVRLAQEA